VNAQKKQDQEREKERKGKAGKTKETEIIKLFRGEISRFPLFLFVFSDIIVGLEILVVPVLTVCFRIVR
jgi:hypothetical protein